MTTNMFSSEFVSAISAACAELCADGSCVTRNEVGAAVAEGGGGFAACHAAVMATLVGEAVKQGAVPGVAMRLGRDGGIYLVSAVAERVDATKAAHQAEVEARKAERAAERAALKAQRDAEKAAKPKGKPGRPKKAEAEPVSEPAVDLSTVAPVTASEESVSA